MTDGPEPPDLLQSHRRPSRTPVPHVSTLPLNTDNASKPFNLPATQSVSPESRGRVGLFAEVLEVVRDGGSPVSLGTLGGTPHLATPNTHPYQSQETRYP